MYTLYTFWRSSAAYRVRLALSLKDIAYEAACVNLVRDGGEQHAAAYRAIHPLGRVPALVTPHGTLTQSQAIIEYLEEAHPLPALLPPDGFGRARVRALAATIACDIHPLNNTSVLARLRAQFGADEHAVNAWYRHWVEAGLKGVEALLREDATGTFCHGDAPGMADCFLVPQVYNARRFGVDLAPFPRLAAASAYLETLPAFAAARPEAQPDAE